MVSGSGERLTQRRDGGQNSGHSTPIAVEVACFSGPVKPYVLFRKKVTDYQQVTVWG